MSAARNNIIHMPRPHVYDSRERIMEALSRRIMTSPWSYDTIARECGLSTGTVQRIGRKETAWPRPRTLFALVRYFNLELELKEKSE